MWAVAALLFILALVITHEYPWLARRFADVSTRVAVWLVPRTEASRTSTWPTTVRNARNDGGDGVSPALGFLFAAVAMRCWDSRRPLATLLRVAAICGFTAAAIMAIVRPGATPFDGLASGPGAVLLPFSLALVGLAELLHPKMVFGRGARGGRGGKPSRSVGANIVRLAGTGAGVGGASASLGGGGLAAHGQGGGSAILASTPT
jgi:hypothetical protein